MGRQGVNEQTGYADYAPPVGVPPKQGYTPAQAPPQPGYPAPQQGYPPQQRYYAPQPGYAPQQGYGAHPGSVQPIPGLKIHPPLMQPAPGQIIVAYETVRAEAGFMKLEGLSQQGLLAVIILLLVCWPLCWIPCIMQECYEDSQRPVYGYPNHQVPVGAPPMGY